MILTLLASLDRHPATQLLRTLALLFALSGVAANAKAGLPSGLDDVNTTAPIVVMLVSYHAGLPWSDEQVRGVKTVLQGEKVDLRLEYLDTKHVVPSPSYYQQIEQLLAIKYQTAAPSLLLASDDDALDLAFQLRQHRYPHIPILFSGVGRARSDALKQTPQIAGIFDDTDAIRNIDLFLKLRPQTKRLFFIHDQSRTSQQQVENIRTLSSRWPQLSFNYLNTFSLEQIRQKLQTLDADDLVFILSFSRDSSDHLLVHEQATSSWASVSNAPLIAQRDVDMHAGVLGGYLVTGIQQGQALGELVKKWLHGTPVNQMPLIDQVATPSFDYDALKRWQIDADSLPPGSIILNKPATLLEISRPFFSLILVLLISLSIIIALLLFLLRIRRRSQLALQRSENNYRELFNSSSEAIFVHDAQDGKLVSVNQRFTALYGHPLEAVSWLRIEDLSANVSPYTKEDAWAWLKKARDEGPQLFEWHAKHASGNLFWAEVSLHLEEIDGMPRIVASARDISERKRAIARAKAIEYQMQQVFQGLPVALFAMDEQHRVTHWNSLITRMTGVSAETMIGCNEAWRGFYKYPRPSVADLVVDGCSSEELAVHYRGAISLGKTKAGVVEVEEYFIREGSKNLWLQITAAPLRDESGQLVGALETLTDITERKLAELALKESESRLWAFIDNTPSLVYMKDLESRYILVNDKFKKILGLDESQILGKTDHDILALDAANNIRANDLELVLRKAPIMLEELVELDGTKYDYLSTKFPIFDDKGNVTLIGGISTDITERKKIEAALKTSEATYRTLIEHAPEAVLVLDVNQDARFVEVNRHAVQLFGYPHEYLIGKTPIDLSWPTQADGRKSEDAATAYIEQALNGVETRFEWISRHADGHPILCEINLVKLPSKDDIKLLRGSVTDITERKAAQAAIVSERNFLQTLLEAIPIPIFYKNKEGIYLGCNDAFLNIMQLKRQDIIGKTVFDWLPEPLAKIYLEKDDLLYSGQSKQVFEKRINEHLGEPRHVVFHRAVYNDADGKVAGMIGAMLDISELQKTKLQLEELNHVLETRVSERTTELQQAMKHLIQSEKLAALGNLVAGIAHELNTPIGNIVTVASTLKDETTSFQNKLNSGTMRRSEALNSAQLMQQAGEMIENNAVRSAKLISDFKQVAVDQSSARRRVFNLRDTIDEVMTTLHPMLKRTAHNVDIVIKYKIEMDSYPGPIEQIVTNLITNSLIHGLEDSKKGHMRISAECEDGMVLLEYSDDGKGMSEETLAQIFDPFYTTKLGQGGSGLGLYIVYNLVNSVLGGKINVTSSPGKGAHFHLRLPQNAPQ